MVLTDFGDQEELRRLVAELAARHDVAHALHLGSEATQLAVCEQADAMGLALNSPRSLSQINDKAAMRALLRGARHIAGDLDRGRFSRRGRAIPARSCRACP